MDMEAIEDHPVMELPQLEWLLRLAAYLDDTKISNRLSSIMGDEPTEADITSLWKRLFQKGEQEFREIQRRRPHGAPLQDRSLPVIKVFAPRAFEFWDQDRKQKLLAWALSTTARRNHPKTAAYLLQLGADPNGDLSPFFSSLYFAVFHGNLEITRLLLDAGASVNPPNLSFGIPLLAAAQRNHPELVRVLLAAGADINARDTRGMTPMLGAVSVDSVAAAHELLKHGPELNQCIGGLPELAWAIHFGRETLVQDLLDAGADPLRVSLFRYCVGHSRVGIMKKLFLYNLNLNEKDKYGNTPLHYIGKHTTVETVKLLVRRGFRVNALSDEGITPLAAALLAKNFEVARYLVLETGADVNTGLKSRHGSSLHIACVTPGVRGLEMVKFLVDHGAFINDDSAERTRTPFHTVCMEHQGPEPEWRSILQYLLDRPDFDVDARGAWGSSNLSIVCLLDLGLDVVKKLIERGAQVDVADEMGRQPIHAATHHDLAYLECLVQAGASLDAKDLMGRNILHMAVSNGRLEVVKYILKHNKDFVNEVDIDGWTPLLWAVHGDEKLGAGDIDAEPHAIVEELLRCGASRLIVGKGLDRNWTALKLARYHDLDDEIIQLVTPTTEELGTLDDKARESWAYSTKNDKEVAEWHPGWYCDGCLLGIYGTYYECNTCRNFAFCFKCYMSKKATHADHDFNEHRENSDNADDGESSDDSEMLVEPYDSD
ncbi:ankyrin repeat-containing domain protein [Apiosordaria backusii]|uniref:Ankyrin repeat-containing domain protein n=1 Tax=Apiosordaria backusii TaxID=314023 RepID=A0AA40BS57_9PEZI|nr:ankyrin repeat-containing domain protein [Apiosordaria backusii]